MMAEIFICLVLWVIGFFSFAAGALYEEKKQSGAFWFGMMINILVVITARVIP